MPANATSLVPAARPRHRRLRVATMVFALVGLVTAVAAGPTFAWSVSAFSPDDEALLLSLTNQDRASAGLNSLVNDSYLHSKAEWRAQDMGDRDYFSHQIPPDGSMVFTYMQQDGYCFKVAGENIGLSTWGDDVATTQIETAFMGSTAHRENILGTWAHVGVGAYQAADGRKLYAVLFSIPCGVTVQPPATPVPPVVTPVPPVATPRPTPRPTPVPTVAPTPVPTPTATPTPTPTATATPSAIPSASSSALAGPFGNGSFTSLRVREKSSSPGLLESFFRWLFGGLFGW